MAHNSRKETSKNEEPSSFICDIVFKLKRKKKVLQRKYLKPKTELQLRFLKLQVQTESYNKLAFKKI